MSEGAKALLEASKELLETHRLLLKAAKTVVRIEDGVQEPGDLVYIMDGHNTFWYGEIVRVNERTFTVRRDDGETRRWDKESAYPYKHHDLLRAAIENAERIERR